MVKLANILSRLNPSKIMIIGDMFLDMYTIGKAKRISPEAPVAVVSVQKEDYRPGGAGNVVVNLLSLGANVYPVGRLGKDWAGQKFLESFRSESINCEMLFIEDGYSTPIKNRIIADNQQIVRIDNEHIVPLNEQLEQTIIDNLSRCLEDMDVVAISDYGKGFLTPFLLQTIIQEAKRKKIPIITDPKGNDFKKYSGTTIIKPNLTELYSAANASSNASIDHVAATVLGQCDAELLMVTRSESGISLFHKKGTRSDFPVHVKEVKDVTGAGDTVLAMLAHSIANQVSYEEAAHLCNVAAGIAIEHIGCKRVSLSDLAHRLFDQNMTGKIFDEEHLFVLKEILKLKAYTLLLLDEIDFISPKLFQVIKEIAKEDSALLVYAADMDLTMIEMLASLKDIHFIIHHLDSLKILCQSSIPEKVYHYDPRGGKFHECESWFSMGASTSSRTIHS